MDIINCPIVNPSGITNFGLSITFSMLDESIKMGIELGYLVKIFADCCFLASKGTRSLNSFVIVAVDLEDLNIENI
jgi:hypothetical protein